MKRPRGPRPGWQPSNPRQAAILADLKDRYTQHQREGTLPRSPRGIFYDLRPRGNGHGVTYTKPTKDRPAKLFRPMEAGPLQVREVLDAARRSGHIPEDWVADARAPKPLMVASYRSVDSFAVALATTAYRFQLDLQRGQRRYVEVWCEAEDMGPRLARVAAPYGVPVYPHGGFGGLKGKRESAERAADREVPTVVLMVTDLDDRGKDIWRSATEDARAWLPSYGPTRVGTWFRSHRIMLTDAQAAKHDLPADEKGKREAEGLPVQVQADILRRWLDRLLDPAIRAEVRAERDRQFRRLPEALRGAMEQGGMVA